MTDTNGNRVVLLTGAEAAHRYVSHVLAKRIGLAGIVCVARPPRVHRQLKSGLLERLKESD